jgi:hypothetical protein
MHQSGKALNEIQGTTLSLIKNKEVVQGLSKSCAYVDAM